MKSKTEETPLKSKEMYKTTLILLKVLPIIMVIAYFLMLVCFYHFPTLMVVPHLLGTVGAPLAFIYITSYVFRFCAFHRIFIHYYAFINVLNVTHHYFANKLNYDLVTFLHETGTIIFLVSAVIMYIHKYKKDKCEKIIDSCTDCKS